jgi:hypothetical protein
VNIVEEKRRSLVGATLLKAQFERSAYGCKLYCCWCAQDLPANSFWESMGFVPLAFRSGSDKKARTHIFWQKRIRRGDTSTPYWFPSQTGGGAIREDRLVFPIPPGKHWSDEMPRILPAAQGTTSHDPQAHFPNPKQITSTKSRAQNKAPLTPTRRFATFGPPSANPPSANPPSANPQPAPAPMLEKSKREKKPKRKNDPKLVAAARELRDRWLERVNDEPSMLLANGKYEIARELSQLNRQSLPALPSIAA